MSDVQQAFAGADFFEGQTFANLDATDDDGGMRVAGKEFFRCTFRDCKLPRSRWERCTFEACVFDGCDLTGMKPASAALRGVVFRDCKLLGAELARVAENPDMTFERCILRYLAFSDLNLRGLTFRECELQDAQFSECSLVDAQFLGCDMTGATFSRCELGGADLASSRGVFLEPRQNTVKGAYVAVETAVMIAQAAGLRVEGYDEPAKTRRKR